MAGSNSVSAIEMTETRNGEDDGLRSTPQDLAVMAKIGKRQQLRRIFGFLPILALSITLLSSWEAEAASLYIGFYNGGPVALVYGLIFTISGVLALAASLSEMASMCPISGAQYHWTYMFAPKRSAAFITWMQGWITVFAWIAVATSVVYLAAGQIQGLIVLNYPDYVYHRYHGTFLMWAIIVLMFIVNLWGIRLLPMIELIGGICHVLFFILLLVTLVVLAPKQPASFVFTTFLNNGGWKSDGVSFCIGLLTAVYSLSGFDGAIHLSEEVKDAATTIPRVIFWSIVINGTLAFGILIACLFAIGNVSQALNSPTKFPIIEIFRQASGSNAGATAMECTIITIAFASCFALLTSVSRLTFAFARDGGMPFARYFAYVNPHYHIPIRSICLVSFIMVLLSLINIGSAVALNAILSLSTLALYVSYLIPIILLFMKRLRKEPITLGPWNLGRFGFWVNLYAILFGVFVSIWLPFPSSVPFNAGKTHVTLNLEFFAMFVGTFADLINPAYFNYCGPVFGGLLILALLDWFFRGRHYYEGPTQEEPVKVDNQEAILETVYTTQQPNKTG